MRRATSSFALWLGRPGLTLRRWQRSQFITCSHCGLRNGGLMMGALALLKGLSKSPVLHLMLACLVGSMVMFAIARWLKVL